MLAKRFANLTRGTKVSYAGIDSLIFSGTAYNYVYLKDSDNNEEKFDIDLFNYYGKFDK